VRSQAEPGNETLDGEFTMHRYKCRRKGRTYSLLPSPRAGEGSGVRGHRPPPLRKGGRGGEVKMFNLLPIAN